MNDKVETARQLLNATAKASYGDKAGFGYMIQQPDNAPLDLGGYFLRSLYVTSNLIFSECYARNGGKWIGCPNPPSYYVVTSNGESVKFREYGEALIYCAEKVETT